MNLSIWDVLGIAATRNVREIKRAYATQLRVTSPEDDPAGYMKLRDAYEAAKDYARHAEDTGPDEIFSIEHPDSNEESNDETNEESSDEPAPEAEVRSRPRPSPQRQAFQELDALLSEGKLDDFLVKVQTILEAQTFSTLDEQNDFIGEVAQLVLNSEIEDTEWRGRLAEVLGARERDNIFAEGSEYWYAYSELLHSYSEMKSAATIAHAQTQEDIGARPGYLHVYHVLTAPFDSERLMALTRSQTYHRLAEIIVERSRTDPAIVIPPENRDWWERTAMAGQHRPAAEPAAKNTSSSSSGFPGWMIWILGMLILNGIRMCNDASPTRTTSQEQTRLLLEAVPSARDLTPEDRLTVRRLASCDTQTRVALFSLGYKRREATDTSGTANTGSPRAQFHLDENDPAVASLLAKCKPPP